MRRLDLPAGRSYLQAQFPNVDFRDGTGIYDLVVRPMGSFAALMKAASVGSQYNLSSGDLLYFTNFNPFFLRGTINYLVRKYSTVTGRAT